MKTTSVLEGESCTFDCHLSHDLDDEPTWTINGQVLVTNSRIQVINNGRKYKMTIRDATVTDAGDVVFTIKDLTCRTMLFVKGEYLNVPDKMISTVLHVFVHVGLPVSVFYFEICHLINTFIWKKPECKGSPFSPPLEKPVHIFRDLLNVKAVPGEDAELSCEITKPEVTIRWLKNGHQLRQSPKYEMSVVKNLARLVIKNTTIRDSGDYCCEAEGVASRAKLEIRGS